MAVGLFWVAPLALKKPRKVSSFWLGAFLVALTLYVNSDQALNLKTVSLVNLWVAAGILGLGLCLGPLLYHYVRSATGYPFRKRQLLHYLPALVWSLLMGTAIALIQWKHLPLPTGQEPDHRWSNLPFDLQKGIYIVLILKTVWSHQKRLKEAFSTGGSGGFRWLVYLIFGTIFLWGLGLLSYFWALPWLEPVSTLASLVFFYFLGWYGLHQPLPPPARSAEKYVRSGMNPQDEALVAERLGQLMDGQKAYLKENLSLDDVASAVRCSPHWISQYINETLKLSFFDYINGLRVEEFLRLALHPDNDAARQILSSMRSHQP